MARKRRGDSYTARDVGDASQASLFVSDMNTAPGRAFYLLPAESGEQELENVRALYFGTSGTISVRDEEGNESTDVPTVAGMVLPVEFVAIWDINCTVYAIR